MKQDPADKTRTSSLGVSVKAARGKKLLGSASCKSFLREVGGEDKTHQFPH